MQVRPHVSDRKGTATVEFAIIATVLVSLLLGVADLVPALLVKLKSAHATSSVADLATQSKQLQASDVADLYAGAGDVLAPFLTTPLVQRVTSVSSDGKGNAFVHWSCGQGILTAFAALATVTITPSGDSVDTVLNRNAVTYGGVTYSTANTSFVMVETRYTFTPVTQFVLRTAITLTNVAYALPRQSSYVGFPWNGAVDGTTAAPASATRTGSVALSNGPVCNYAY
jgi:Flp pilus assembly protein TadG